MIISEDFRNRNLTSRPHARPYDAGRKTMRAVRGGAAPSGEMDMGEVARTGAESLVDHHGFLKAYFTRQLKSTQDAEDYVHEVYSRVLASVDSAPTVKNWRAMLLTVAKSVVIDQFRRDAARRHDQHMPLDDDLDLLHDPQPDPESAVSARQRLAAAEKVLAELDPVCRQAFLLARVEGFGHKEIAKRLGIAQQSVGRHVQQALYALARQGWNDSGS